MIYILLIKNYTFHQLTAIKIIIIIWSIIMMVMPEQQKVDETIESTSKTTDKKMPKKDRTIIYIFRKRWNYTIDSESENNEDSILESDAEDLKEL